ncbi:hypothetical protein ETR_14131 [Erwinia tracheiphila PSU-1]|nr:hypothetical protein ETR_14131 [Erwinia tracheiphila PSU-1]
MSLSDVFGSLVKQFHLQQTADKAEDTQCCAGSGDRRYFRVAICYASQQQINGVVIVIPEELAPNNQVRLWQAGQ